MSARAWLVWILGVLVIASAAAPVQADETADWAALQASYRRLFVPLPISRLFSRNLEQELKLSRRDPFTREAREELARDRDAITLRRAQLNEARSARAALIGRLAISTHPKAPEQLMRAYDRVRADVDLARKNSLRHGQAAGADINPGKDPGGHYWKTWVGREAAAARATLAAEQTLLTAILVACGNAGDPAVRAWLRTKAAKDPLPEIRLQMVQVLAAGTDPGAVLVLRSLFAGERETWMRVAILNALAAGRLPGAAEIAQRALQDKAWPVQSAALAALYQLDARDTDAIEAMISAMERTSGRLRFDLREGLVWATGQPLEAEPTAWRAWWANYKDGWKPFSKPAPAALATGKNISWCFGVPTTSKRIVFIVNQGANMRKPIKRRATGNDGKPSPEPRVDTAYNVALWELGEAISTLPKDAAFTVITMAPEPAVWSKKLKKASKDACTKTLRFLKKLKVDGRSNVAGAVERALRIGQPKGLEDVAYGTEAGVDTIFLIGSSDPKPKSLARKLRRVTIHPILLGDLTAK